MTTPHPPYNVTVLTTARSAKVSWLPAYDGGHPQHYVLWSVFQHTHLFMPRSRHVLELIARRTFAASFSHLAVNCLSSFPFISFSFSPGLFLHPARSAIMFPRVVWGKVEAAVYFSSILCMHMLRNMMPLSPVVILCSPYF